MSLFVDRNNTKNLCKSNLNNLKKDELVNECKKLFSEIDNLCKERELIKLSAETEDTLPTSSTSTSQQPEQKINCNIIVSDDISHKQMECINNCNEDDEKATPQHQNQQQIPENSDNVQQQQQQQHHEQQQEQTNPIPSTSSMILNKIESIISIDENGQQMTPSSTSVVIQELNLLNERHQQYQLHSISEENLKILICELKRKIEYIENMNWLCEYYVLYTFTIICIYNNILFEYYIRDYHP